MTPDRKPQEEETSEQRKERLRLQCRAYRAGIGRARNTVRAHLGADEIAKTAIGLISARAQSALANFSDLLDFRSMSGAKLQRLLPLVVSGVSLLARRSLWRPILKGAAVAGTAAATVYFFSRKKTKKSDGEHIALHEHL